MSNAAASSIVRIAALAALINGLAFTSAANAQPVDTVENPSMTQPAATAGKEEKMDHTADAMARHVEDRIKTLHGKLKITGAQETKWANVAQVMRDNEAAVSRLVQTRQQNAEGMTAIDDLQSYADITQAHVDGIKKLIPPFQDLYNDMSDAQKTEANKVFGDYEGHKGKWHHK
ncbi:MAG: Spy/CpxP family protein refolding chaperone [Alphaproteobacteria bacterium]